MNDGRLTGAIATLKEGYGFIEADGHAGRHFFHYQALDSFGPRFDELGIGQEVSFLSIESPKGLRAIEVRVVDR